MDSEIRLDIAGFVQNQAMPGTYAMVMQEAGGGRRFSIIVGEAEAQSVALKMRGKALPRPLAHQLMANILSALHAELKKVVICRLANNVFYTDLHVEDAGGDTLAIDARTSDAVALAAWAGCPIYIKEEILDAVGTPARPHRHGPPARPGLDDVEDATEEELRLLGEACLLPLLEQAVAQERYELAARLKKALDQKTRHL